MEYYRVDARKLTFAELWRISMPGFPLLALLKILRIRLPDRTAIPYPLRVVPLDESELDVDGRRARTRREFAALEADGFQLKLLYKVPILSPDTTTFAAAFLSSDTWVYAVVLDGVTRVGSKTVRDTRLSLVTPLADGRFLATGSKRDLDSPPEFEGEIVRGSRERLVRRHRERMREVSSSPRSIDGDDLLGFVSELERRAAEFHIGRGVWVPLSPGEAEKAREYKPRGKTWQLGNAVVGWVFAVALSLAWTLWGVRGCAALPGGGRDVEDMWSDQPRIVHDCSSGSMGDTAPDAAPQVATVAGLFASVDEAASMEAPARSALDSREADGRGRFSQIGNAAFYRATDGAFADARPVYDAWTGSARSVAVLGQEAEGRTLSLTAVWTVSGGEDEERASSVEAYLDTGIGFPLRPPWATDEAGRPAVTPGQANARRTLHRLQKAEREQLMADMLGPVATVKAIWQGLTASYDDGDWRKQMQELHSKRIQALRTLARRLAEEDSTLDAEVLQLYVAHQDETGRAVFEATSSNPFEQEDEGRTLVQPTQSERQLRERLGALPMREEDEDTADDIDEGLSSSFAEMGWVIRSGDEIGVQVFLADPAVSTPAILDFVCGGEATEVTYGFSSMEG